MKNKDKIIKMIIGGMTFSEVGRRIGLSRERIRQICKKEGIIRKPFKKDLPKVESYLEKKHKSFGLSKELYDLASRKFVYKRRNNRDNSSARWDFTIKFEDVPWVTHCPILGIKLNYKGKSFSDDYASFDRIDSSKGYIKGNVAIISWKANKMKSNGSSKDHRNIADWIDNNTK